MSWLSSAGRKLFGGGTQTTTNTTALDPASQRYVDAMRQQAQAGSGVIMGGPGGGGGSWFTGPQTQSIGDQAAAFFNPYMSNVVDATRGEFDHLRGQAMLGANQQATQASAFGGSRHALMAGTRLGELDRAQASQIGGMLAGGYQNALSQGTAYAEQQRQLQQQQMMEPIWRQQQAQAYMAGGMGPYGQTSTTTAPGQGLIPGLIQGAAGAYNIYKGMQQPQQQPGGYQAMQPQAWQTPQWNPQYRGPYG